MVSAGRQEGADSGEEMEIPESYSILLGEFISDNSNLFVVMGVFAAFAAYISSIPIGDVDEQYVRLGLVSSFMAAGIIWLMILMNLLSELGMKGNPLRNFFSPVNIDVGLFFIVFNLLFYSLFQIVLQEPREVAFIIYLAIIGGVLLIWMTVTWKVGELMFRHYPHYEFCLGLSSSIVGLLVYHLLGVFSADIAKETMIMDFGEMTESSFSDIVPSIVYHSFMFSHEVIPIAIFFSVLMTLPHMSQFFSDIVNWIYNRCFNFDFDWQL